MNSITSLYIHFPFCQHLCNYCDFYKHKLEGVEQVVAFEALLAKQISFQKEFLKKNDHFIGKLETLYVGGGTPSLWKKEGITFLRKLIESKELVISENCEFTIEVDPDTWTEEEIDGWLSIGVNRFSIGSQAFSEKFIKIMDRTHALEDVVRTIKYFHERDLNYSVDLMLGLPYSKERDILIELDHLLKYQPKHLSVYILKTRKNYEHIKNLPDDEYIRNEYLSVCNKLKENGFEHYEVSNFSRDGFKSKHNIKYWKYNSVAGLGPNATGLIVNKESAIRYQWKSVSLGLQEELLENTSLKIEKLFLGIRFNDSFDLTSFFSDKDDRKNIETLFSSWIGLGYIEENSTVTKMNLSDLGFLMSDSLLDDIFKKIDF